VARLYVKDLAEQHWISFISHTGAIMKKKNPFYWDISSLPEEEFKQTALARYRKDKDTSKRRKRGAVYGSIGSLPRKGSKAKWLPSVRLFWLEAEALRTILGRRSPRGRLRKALLPDLTDQRKYLIELTQIVRQNEGKIRDFLGATRSTDIIYITSVRYTIKNQPEALTPFMMVHDIGEFLWNGGFAKEWKEIAALATIELAAPVNLARGFSEPRKRFVVYLPKLVHLQPFPDRPQTHINVAAYTRPIDSNYYSDLWALWCKKERLVPAHFWRKKVLLDHLEETTPKMLGGRPQKASFQDIVKQAVPIQEYCDVLNAYFSRTLDHLKGAIIID
jgi:hypothetical protein